MQARSRHLQQHDTGIGRGRGRQRDEDCGCTLDDLLQLWRMLHELQGDTKIRGLVEVKGYCSDLQAPRSNLFIRHCDGQPVTRFTRESSTGLAAVYPH